MFVVLYTFAAVVYPGGSHAMPDQIGFSFSHNYLCDLLDSYAINGVLNGAKIFATIALAILCFSIVLLWFFLSELFLVKSVTQPIMRITGIASLITLLFLTSETHDIIVNIAGVLGTVSFASCLMGLFKAKYYKLFIIGFFCLLIFLGNYYIYETGTFIYILPVVQKVTFVCFLSWFVLLDISVYKSVKSIGTPKNRI